MRKLCFVALCALMMAGCAKGYEFKVVASVGYPNAVFYLSPEAQPSAYYVSAESDAEGVVCFEGRGEFPMVACISDGLVNVAGPIFLEEGEIKVERLVENPSVMVPHGTTSNDAYCEYLVSLQELNHRFDTISNPDMEALEPMMVAAFDSLDRCVEGSNYDNVFGVYLFVKDGVNRCSTRAEVDSVVSLFAPELRNHPYVSDVLNTFVEEK